MDVERAFGNMAMGSIIYNHINETGLKQLLNNKVQT
jgi:hypothetical protein